MFLVNEYIYLIKYKVNDLEPDTNKKYKILHIEPNMIKTKYGNTYEKYATLYNGDEQLLYSYNCYTKQYDFFAESVPTYRLWCCF